MGRKKQALETTEFIKAIEDRYGENIITKNDDVASRELEVIPTGSISLDLSTGVGGIARGRFTEIYGPESSGKTSLCFAIAKSAIEHGLRVLYVEPENSLDWDYVEQILGKVDEKQFVLAQPETAEQSLFTCEMAIKTNEFDLIILDSIGALVTEAELEDDPDKSHVALVSRKLGSFLGRVGWKLRTNNIAFIFVNQIRDAIGNPYAGMSTPGGHSLKHMLAMRIQLNKSEDIEKSLEGGKKEKIGILSRYLIKKNKLASPFKTFSFPLIFGKGIDRVYDLVNFAEMLGILTKRGAYYVFEGEMIGQGLAKTIEHIREHKELLAKIEEMCYNTVKQNNSLLKEEEDDGTDNES